MTIQPKDLIILSIAVGDFVQAFHECPLAFTSAVSRKWIWGDFGCAWYAFVTTWVGLASISQILIFTVERFITLSSPMPNMITIRRTGHLILVSWMLSLGVSCLPLFGWSTFTLEGLGLHCSINWESRSTSNLTFCLFLLTFFFAVPAVTIVVAGIKTFIIVRRMFRNANRIWGPDAQATKQSYVAQVKTARRLSASIFVFFLAWTPYAIMASCQLIPYGRSVSVRHREYPSMFSKTSVLLNPCIYFYMYRSLRQKALWTLKCRSTDSYPE